MCVVIEFGPALQRRRLVAQDHWERLGEIVERLVERLKKTRGVSSPADQVQGGDALVERPPRRRATPRSR